MEQILAILGTVGFDWHAALANFVNFLIVFVLLYKFVFTKLGKTIDTRSKTIAKGLDDAKESARLLSSAEQEKNAILGDAHNKHVAIIEEASEKAEVLAAEIKKEAEIEAQALREKLAKEKMELSLQVEKDFRDKAPGIVAALYEKTLRTSMTKEANDALIANQ
jgi:F-type H+-transporting ATPase subunit b